MQSMRSVDSLLFKIIGTCTRRWPAGLLYMLMWRWSGKNYRAGTEQPVFSKNPVSVLKSSGVDV